MSEHTDTIDWLSAFRELEKIYELVDNEIRDKQSICQQCGECCNFWQNGMKLYIYHIEREYIRRRCQKVLTLYQGCCGGQKDRLCLAHLIRPLGCRTQFCAITLDHVYEKYAREIRALEKKYGIEYRYEEAFENSVE